ncbi:MAG TPA: TetR/AcrR family transcriptional regulator [Solirubrobacterales bacterium]
MVITITRTAQPISEGEKSGFRRRLLDGLAKAIRDKGLARAQITDIVANARTSNRTFYECFADKEACFEALIEEWGEEILAAVEAATDPEAPWQEQVDASVDAYLGAFAADPSLTVTVTRELPTLGQRGVEWQERDIDRYVDLMERMTATRAMRDAGVEPVSRETAMMLIGGIAELLDRVTREGRSPDSIAATVKKVIKRVIGPG